MKTITIFCLDDRDAERELNKLYCQYDKVRLVGFPLNYGAGDYTFRVWDE